MSPTAESHSPAPVAWCMPLLLRLTLACHLLAVGVALWYPTWAAWALAGVVVNHLVLTAAVLWPRGAWLGPNLVRLPTASVQRGEIAITIDDGPDPAVTPQVLDQLDRAGARATFFCIAEQVARHPALAREILARGHDLQNHTATHRHTFSLLGPRGTAVELQRAQQLILQVTGHRPTCFRAPAGFRNCFLDPVLHRLGLRLVSWTRRGFDTREADPQRVLVRLTRGLAAGDILLLHDGHASRTADGQAVILAVLPALLARCADAGLRTVTLGAALSALADGRVAGGAGLTPRELSV